MENNFWQKAGLIIVFLTVSAIAFFLGVLFLDKQGFFDKNLPEITEEPIIGINPSVDPQQIDEIKKQRETEWQRYLTLNKVDVYPNGLTTPKSLISACEDGNKNQESCNKEIEKVFETLKTEQGITKAYLYIKAGISRENKPLGDLTEYDSIWFYISDDFEMKKTKHIFTGGHLLRNKAIINRIDEDGLTELLFDMNELPITVLPYDESNEPTKTDNALKLLNEGGKHFIGGFVSTRGLGKILEMKIGYEGGAVEKIK